MTIAPYSGSAIQDRMAISLRPNGLPRSTSAISAIQTSDVCPKCGRSGYDCCEYDDRILISAEGQAKSTSLASPQEIQQPQHPQTSRESSDQTSSTVKSSDPSLTATPSTIEAVEERESSSEDKGGDERESAGDGRQGQTVASDKELTDEEKKQVEELKQRDQEVRQHEAAHQSAAGDLAVGGPHYTYETGPDGKQYATGGEVKIAVGSGDTPEEKLKNAQQAARAALAPAEPSGQDRAVAAEAQQTAMEAQQEMNGGSVHAADDSSGETASDTAATETKSGDDADTPLTRALSRAVNSYKQQTSTPSKMMNLGESYTPDMHFSISA